MYGIKKFRRGSRYKKLLRGMARRRRNNFGGGIVGSRIMKYVSKGAYGQETKTADFVFSGNVYATNYVPDVNITRYTGLPINANQNNIQAVNLITQGPGVQQRIGNKISLKSLRLRLSLGDTVRNPAAPLAWNAGMAINSNARLFVTYDRQPSGNAAYPNTFAAAATGIISAIAQDGTTTFADPQAILYANIDVNNLERYTMLMDKTLVLPGKGQIGAGGGVMQYAVQEGPTAFKEPYLIDEFVKLRDLETVFNGTPAANAPVPIANVVTGALYLCSIGEIPTTLEPWYWRGVVRTRFHDN